MDEYQAMRRAMELALKGWGRVAPNPLVGAVLLRDGKVIGEGYHVEFGGSHAEVAALAACDQPRGAVCVVNLEPCTHLGKTPACSEALKSAGIGRLVFATADPNYAAGGGAELLRSAGIEVESGVCQEAAAALNASFLWSEVRRERPFVALKLAISLDGFLADKWGNSQWISSPEAREHVHWLRAGYEAIGVGRRTAQADNPWLTARGNVVPRVPPARIVFSRSGSLRTDLHLVKTAKDVPTILIVDDDKAAAAGNAMADTGVAVIGARGPKRALEALRGVGIRSLLVEGGGGLAVSLLEAGLVDRLFLFQAPLLLSQGLSPFPTTGPVPLEAAERWIPVERKAFGDSNLLVLDRKLCLLE